MRYAYVENEQIVLGPKALPKSWKNISGLNLMDDVSLAALGWLPWRVVDAGSPGQDWVETSPTVELKSTEIVETKTYRQKTQEEIEIERQLASVANKSLRAKAYVEESDPLFFKAQRGEATMEEWLAKVEEIKVRYPA
jgi:hypothetical protein